MIKAAYYDTELLPVIYETRFDGQGERFWNRITVLGKARQVGTAAVITRWYQHLQEVHYNPGSVLSVCSIFARWFPTFPAGGYVQETPGHH